MSSDALRTVLAHVSTACVILALLVGCGGESDSSSHEGTDGAAASSPHGTATKAKPEVKATLEPKAPAAEDAPADLDRARVLLTKAQESFHGNNHQKARKQAEAALRALGTPTGGAEKLRFWLEQLLLYCSLRLEEVDDPVAAVADLETRYPGSLTPDNVREIASDLAFARRYDVAVALLRDAADRYGPAGAPLRAHAAFLDRLGKAVAERPAAPAKVDPNYLNSMQRNRASDHDGMFEYAMRARNIGVHEKALLALTDAAWLAERAEERDPSRAFLIEWNRVLSWVALGAGDVALEEFAALGDANPARIGWISYHQLAMELATAGDTARARSILESGKTRFPAEASRFDAELERLEGK